MRTTLPVPPTPLPGPGDIGDPFADIGGAWPFSLAQDATIPDNVPNGPTWELAPGQTDKATLQGRTLHALKPGGILLVAHSGARAAYRFMAAYDPSDSTQFDVPGYPLGNSRLNGSLIINSNADWDAYYKTISMPCSAILPAQSPPPIDYSRYSLLLYQIPSGPFDTGICITSVASGTVNMAITSAVAEGEPQLQVYSQLQLQMLIPKVPATATVNIERMPPEVVPSETPHPRPSIDCTPTPLPMEGAS
ncbi:MAG TPA: hypothetical protein V6D47_18960 [Oscillatoriaceae cyanobacterium]